MDKMSNNPVIDVIKQLQSDLTEANAKLERIRALCDEAIANEKVQVGYQIAMIHVLRILDGDKKLEELIELTRLKKLVDPVYGWGPFAPSDTKKLKALIDAEISRADSAEDSISLDYPTTAILVDEKRYCSNCGKLLKGVSHD